MKNLYRAQLSLLVVLATLFLANCGGGAPGCGPATFGTPCTSSGGPTSFGGGTGGTGGGGGGGSTGVSASQAAALVYYGNVSIAAAGLTSAGTFGTLSSYTAPKLASNLADDMLIVNKKFLYVPMGDTTVAGFSIDRSTGTLTVIPGSPFTVPGTAVTADDVATDPLTRFLFVGSETTPNIWVFQINLTTGALTLTVGSPFQTGLTLAADILAVDASGRFLYAGQTDPTLGVAGYSIDQTSGALTAIPGSPFALAVAQLHASPTAELLVGTAAIQDGHVSATDPHIYVYSLDSSTGVPTAVSGSPFLTASAPFDFAISPNGRYLYGLETIVATQKDAPIEGFSLNSGTGALASIGTFSGVPTAEGCQFDQTGVYLFCIDALSGGSMMTVNGANPSSGALLHGADLAAAPDFPFAVTD
jgi:6-phosphogluconolactonase (cycloisomerase 2 family)